MTSILLLFFFFFFFNDTATTEIYTLSLHDALPICHHGPRVLQRCAAAGDARGRGAGRPGSGADPQRADGGLADRSEEHTSELQSQSNLVCRLLLEKKKNKIRTQRQSQSPTCHSKRI